MSLGQPDIGVVGGDLLYEQAKGVKTISAWP